MPLESFQKEKELTQGKNINTSEIGHQIMRSDIKTICVAGMVDRISSLQMEYTSKELEISQHHMGKTGQKLVSSRTESNSSSRSIWSQLYKVRIFIN